jgi:hypothetical protein
MTYSKRGADMKTITEKYEREEIKNAIKWISGQLENNAGQPVQKLLNKAIFEFNLSPADADFLMRFYHDRAA